MCICYAGKISSAAFPPSHGTASGAERVDWEGPEDMWTAVGLLHPAAFKPSTS